MGNNFAIYRLPGGGANCNVIECDEKDVVFLKSYSCVGIEKGFVFAPFDITTSCPLILLPSKECGVRDIHSLYDDVKAEDVKILNIEEDRATYKKDFAKFRDKTSCGEFHKIVLSRRSVAEVDKELDGIRIFERLCSDYPNSFVAIVKTKVTGTWIMATPEVLLESTSCGIHTMALAGTRKIGNTVESKNVSLENCSPEWDEKNKKEQEFVSEYIKDCLTDFTDELNVSLPHTIRYGDIEHLRSDFYFQKKTETQIGRIVSALHPTPAVCGLPADKTFDYIHKNEHNDRQYYSGFCGPYCGDDNFHFFVTLRCMKAVEHRAELFAGGGILPDSNEEDEWVETQLKMLAMKRTLCR